MALRRKAGGGGRPGSPGRRQDNSGTPGLRPQKAVDATNCAGHAFSGSVNDSVKLTPGSAQFQGMSQVWTNTNYGETQLTALSTRLTSSAYHL